MRPALHLGILASTVILSLACGSPKVIPLVPGGEAHNFGYEARLHQVDAAHWTIVVSWSSDFDGGGQGSLLGEAIPVLVSGGGLVGGTPTASWTFDAARWRRGEPFRLELRQKLVTLVEVKVGSVVGSAEDFRIAFLERK